MTKKVKTKAVFFDVAGTLIEQKSWLFLAEGLGLQKEYNFLMASLKNKKIGQKDLNQKLSVLFTQKKRVNKEELKKILSVFNLKAGAKDVIDYLKSKNIAVFLISGANQILVANVAEVLQVDGWMAATEFVFDTDGQLVDVVRAANQGQWKVDQVSKVMAEKGWNKSEVFFVGDGWNDIYVFDYLKRGITFDFGNWNLKRKAYRVVSGLAEIAKII